MSKNSTEARLVSLSVSAYEILITAYPSPFREEYGPHMVQFFRDICIRSHDRQGWVGVLLLWVSTFFDLVGSVIAEHLQRESARSRRFFIRISGWALMLGGIAFTLQTLLSTVDSLHAFLPNPAATALRALADETLIGIVLLGPLLIVVGLIGLGVRSGAQGERWGRAILFLGAACGAAAVPLAIVADRLQPVIFERGQEFILTYAVLIGAMFVCLLLFGIITLRRKALPRWNGLPILAGLWVPLTFLASGFSTDNLSNSGLLLTVPLFAAAMILLGYCLQADPDIEPAASL